MRLEQEKAIVNARILLVALAALLALPAFAQEKFRTPEAAVDALAKAAAATDRSKIRQLLGPEDTAYLFDDFLRLARSMGRR